MKRFRSNWFGYIILAGFLLYGIVIGVKFVLNIPGYGFSWDTPKTYREIFSDSTWRLMKKKGTTYFTSIPPITHLRYDEYELLVDSFNIKDSFSLERDVQLSGKDKSFGLFPGVAKSNLGTITCFTNLTLQKNNDVARLYSDGVVPKTINFGKSFRLIQMTSKKVELSFLGNQQLTLSLRRDQDSVFNCNLIFVQRKQSLFLILIVSEVESSQLKSEELKLWFSRAIYE